MLSIQTLAVAQREKFNLSLEPELMKQFEELTKRYGSRKKWVSMSVAMLLLLDAPEEVREHLMGQVLSAEFRAGSLQELIEHAKSHRLIAGAQKAIDKTRQPSKS